MNHDELMKQMEADERNDRLEAATHTSVIEYAKSRGLQPQLVYYYIRNRKIEQIPCPCCGRKVIAIAQADEVMKGKK